ncbi:acetyl-CoA hydrolase/transferase family protein [Dehalobacterium formicoaceticum]|uniref:Acetyl-CoA hydrolase/transferase family protein n=1 Tax=Dehalobacterium formicoaceticum TaxID=51515 RepID=A0ABT1Y7T9_9FIRM|nr:acetyl-CoA hydrolase/transferase C-terminal domain-containing protein [Dehalobacterium formicoaceticum]MCR6546951.1 acetyl-CoA hydrolase/transferase family protein [Dehalobacterium formicoaceticum]
MNSIILEPQGFAWEKDYFNKLVSLKEAAAVVKSGDHVAVAQASSAAKQLINALCARKDELEDVEVYGGNFFEPFALLRGEFKGHLNFHTFFMQGYERNFLKEGNIDVSSIPVRELDYWYKDVAKLNVALLEVSPPNKDGYMSVGPAGGQHTPHLVDAATTVIVCVNKQVPFVNGIKGALIPVSEVDYIAEADDPMFSIVYPPASEIELRMGKFIADKIHDGDCIQVGIGGVANAICDCLLDKNDLGLHSEMISDGVMKLFKNGNLTGKRKQIDVGLMPTGGGIGTPELFKWMSDTPELILTPGTYVNDPIVIAQNNNQVSINSAIMIDLTGQLCAENYGYGQFSGIGGHLDFAIGASLSKGGKSFITMPSINKDKKTSVVSSKIVSVLPPGAAVTTPRALAQYIVTEYGIVNLKCRSLSERAKLMISIAHPDFRDQLTQEAKDIGLIK